MSSFLHSPSWLDMMLIAGAYSGVCGIDEDQGKEFGWIDGDVWGTGKQWRTLAVTMYTSE